MDLNALLTSLEPDLDALERAFAEIMAHVVDSYVHRSVRSFPYLPAWEPVIAEMVVVDGGGTNAAAGLAEEFRQYENSGDWGNLVRALRRLLAGERGEQLLEGLDNVDSLLTIFAERALEGSVTVPGLIWHAIPLRWVLADVIDGSLGDDAANQRSRVALESLASVAAYADLAAVLARILAGERDPAVSSELEPPFSAFVAMVLYHIGAHFADDESK